MGDWVKMILQKINTALVAVAAIVLTVFAITSQGRADQAAGEITFIPGKTLGMKPPAGFELSTKFSGFLDPASGSSLLLVELPPEAYKEIAAGMTSKALADKGITVATSEPIKLGGVDGLIVKGTQTAQGKQVNKWILVLGAPAATVILTAQDLSGTALNDKAVMAAFQSIRFRDAPTIAEQLEKLPFALGDLGGFRVVRTIAGTGVLLTKGPKDVVKDSSQPMVVILRPLSQPFPASVFPADLSERLLRAVKAIQISTVEKTTEVSVAGAQGYETMASAIDRGANTQVVVAQWLRLDSGQQMRILAIMPEQGSDTDLVELRKMVTELRMK